MVKAYFTACEQAFPAQRAQLRRLSLALRRSGVERMEQLCAMQRAWPEGLLELRSIGAKSLPLIAAICAQYEANRTPSQGGTPLRETGMPSCRRRRRNPMTRRLLSMFCALALCLSLLPGTALAAEEVSYLAYSWNGSELTSETESVSDYAIPPSRSTASSP